MITFRVLLQLWTGSVGDDRAAHHGLRGGDQRCRGHERLRQLSQVKERRPHARRDGAGADTEHQQELVRVRGRGGRADAADPQPAQLGRAASRRGPLRVHEPRGNVQRPGHGRDRGPAPGRPVQGVDGGTRPAERL